MIFEKEIKSLLGGKTVVKIKIYDSAQECFEAHLGCKLSEIGEMGGFDGDGKEFKFTPDAAMENMIKTGCWGFCDQEDTLHIWCSAECQLDNLIHLLAHERGHTLKPWHRKEEREEIKADRYGETARFAYQTALQLLESVKSSKGN